MSPLSSIPPTFGQAIAAAGMAALAAAALGAAARSPAMRELCEKFRRMSRIGQAVVLAAVICLVAYSGTKPGGAPQSRSLPAIPEPPPFALVEARTNGVAFVAASTNAVVAETILRRGVSEGGEWIEWDGPGFLWGTNKAHRAYAFPAGLSFDTMRRPRLDASLPDGTNIHALVALRTPLGIAPEANWHLLNAPSRFWHDATPLGHVFTWENALLGRLADSPATIQIETRGDGAFLYRYDFSQATPTNSLVVGAQFGNSAVEAMSIFGGATNSATVWRVDGAPATNGVPVAGLFASAPRLELRWANTAGWGDLSGDTDNDGLADWEERYLYATDSTQADTDGDGTADGQEIQHGTDPLDPDEDSDGIPDGMAQADWELNPFWGATAGDTNFVATLSEDIPDGMNASLVFGGLSIPLRQARSFPLFLPAGQMIPFRLFSTGESPVALSIEAAGSPDPPWGYTMFAAAPLWLDDPAGVFGGQARFGVGRLAVPILGLTDEAGRDFDADECIHDGNPTATRTWTVSVLPDGTGLSAPDLTLYGFRLDGPRTISLSVGSTPGESASGEAILEPPALRLGWIGQWRSIHRCEGGVHSACSICGHNPVTSVCATNVFFTLPIEGGGFSLPDEGQNPTTNFVHHSWVEDDDYSIRDYAVILHPVPGDCDASVSDMQGTWGKLSGPDSGMTCRTNQVDLMLRKPEVGGIYRFQYNESPVSGSGSVESFVILPLGGPDVTAYLVSEMQRYSAWAAAVKGRIGGKTELSDTQKGWILLTFFSQTAAAMNHKFATYETASSPYRPLCHDTVTIAGHVLGKDQIGNILYAFAGERLGLDLGTLRFGGKVFAAISGTVDHPDDREAYVLGHYLGTNPDADLQQALEARNLSILQSSTAKIGWPSSETTTGPTYPVFGLRPANE